MAQTPPPTITPAPTPAPQRGDRTTFSDRVDAFVMWLITAVGQFAAVAANVYSNAVDAFNNAVSAAQSATIATTQANAAIATVGVQAFSGTKNYAAGEAAYSLVNGQTYRRLTAGTNATDPSNSSLWRLLSGNDINGTFEPIAITGTVIDLSLGNYFKTSKSANTTFTFTNVPAAGSSFMLELETLAANLMIGFPASVRSQSNIAPSFQANKSHRLSFISSNGGVRFAMSAATNYDI